MDQAAIRTASVTQGAARLFVSLGHAVLREVSLPHGRRADLLALGPDDSFVIVEVKSCERDFLSDAKWPEYRAFCDRLYFAVDPAFPHAMLPNETGLLVADAYGGAVLREAWRGVATERPACPMLCVASAHDDDVPPSITRAMAEAWGADVLQTVSGSHVGPLLGREAAGIAAQAVEWLNRAAKAG